MKVAVLTPENEATDRFQGRTTDALQFAASRPVRSFCICATDSAPQSRPVALEGCALRPALGTRVAMRNEKPAGRRSRLLLRGRRRRSTARGAGSPEGSPTRQQESPPFAFAVTRPVQELFRKERTTGAARGAGSPEGSPTRQQNEREITGPFRENSKPRR